MIYEGWKAQRQRGRRRVKARVRLERIYNIRRRRHGVIFSRIGFAVWGMVAIFLIVKDCT